MTDSGEANRAIVVSPTPATVDRVLTEVNLTVQGVSSGTSAERVQKLLGEPLKTKEGPFDDCSSGYHRFLEYDGLIIDLLSDSQRRNYSVTGIDVRSPKWLIDSGLRIGDKIERVHHDYGPPVYEEGDRFGYVMRNNDGGVDFYYQNGILFRVAMRTNLC